MSASRAAARNEHALARQRVTPYLKRVARTGALWYVKLGAWRWVVGLPDYIACVRGHFVAIELKHPTDATSKASARQRYVLDCIARAGGTVAVCRDVDDVEHVVRRVLDDGAHGLVYAFDARVRSPAETSVDVPVTRRRVREDAPSRAQDALATRRASRPP